MWATRIRTLKAVLMFAIFYSTLALLLLTLNPFNPQLPTTPFIWQFLSWLDVGQNILAFMPLGMALQQSGRFSHNSALLYGLLLSTLIEVCQLWLPLRYSGLFDILSNAAGAGLGSLIWIYVRKQTSQAKLALSSMMLLPLCWIIALRNATSSDWSYFLGLEVFLGLFLLHRANANMSISMVWSVMAVAPLFSIKPTLELSFLFILLLPLLTQQKYFTQHVCLKIAGTIFSLMLFLNILWLYHNVWTWDVSMNLRWIELLLLALWLWQCYQNQAIKT